MQKIVRVAKRKSRKSAEERFAWAIEAAREARDSGHNVSRVREMVIRARAAYDEGDYETAIDFSDAILSELRGVLRGVLLAEQLATTPSGHPPQEHRHWPVGLMALGIMLLITAQSSLGLHTLLMLNSRISTQTCPIALLALQHT